MSKFGHPVTLLGWWKCDTYLCICRIYLEVVALWHKMKALCLLFWVAFFQLMTRLRCRIQVLIYSKETPQSNFPTWVLSSHHCPDSLYCELLTLSYKAIKCNYYLQDRKRSVQNNHQVGHCWVTCWFNLWTGASAGDDLSQFKYDIEQWNNAYLRLYLQNAQKLKKNAQFYTNYNVYERSWTGF